MFYGLTPRDGHKSFYGKAKVLRDADGREMLFSYDTRVLVKDPDGTLYKTWDGWSATTGRHVAAFCGLNKQEFLGLPLIQTPAEKNRDAAAAYNGTLYR